MLLINAAFQDAVFKRELRLSEGCVYYKWLTESAAFMRGNMIIQTPLGHKCTIMSYPLINMKGKPQTLGLHLGGQRATAPSIL